MDRLHKIIFTNETHSTNSDLKKLQQEQTLPEFLCISTNFQTQGRGQRGNKWESERNKNLLFSTILYPRHLPAYRQFAITQIISLSLKNVLKFYVDDISIKWPNDIYWREKKIAGILIENALTANNIDYSIIGVGLNINQEAFATNAPNPTSLKLITGRDYNVDDILEKILDELYRNYTESLSDLTNLHNEYNNSLFRKSGWHTFSDGYSSFLAQISEVKTNGTLVLQLQSNIKREFLFKEVSFILQE